MKFIHKEVEHKKMPFAAVQQVQVTTFRNRKNAHMGWRHMKTRL